MELPGYRVTARNGQHRMGQVSNKEVAIALARYTWVQAFNQSVADRNVSVVSAARRARMPLLVTDPREFIPKRFLFQYVDCLTADAHWPLLGLDVGLSMFRDGAAHRLITLAAAEGSTLFSGMRTFARLIRHEANQLPVGLEIDETGAYFWYRGRTQTVDGPPGARQMELLILGLFLALIRTYRGTDWLPSRVDLQAVAPNPALRRRLEHIPMRFQQREMRVPVAIEELAFTGKSCFDAVTAPESKPIPADLPGSLRMGIVGCFADAANTPITLDLAAEMSGLTARTLQRRLRKSGLMFRDVVDEALVESATRYLVDSTLPIYEIAHIHGYQDTSHFIRAFQRCAGTSPGQFRNLIAALI